MFGRKRIIKPEYVPELKARIWWKFECEKAYVGISGDSYAYCIGIDVHDYKSVNFYAKIQQRFDFGQNSAAER